MRVDSHVFDMRLHTCFTVQTNLERHITQPQIHTQTHTQHTQRYTY